MSEHHSLSGKKLLWAALLNFIITAAEIIGGLMSNSLALLSDALHNFSDGVAVFIAYVANKVSRRSASEKKTFGFKRIEILAALFNAVVLVAISFYLFYEAYKRFRNPEEIKAGLMMIVAVIGLLANIAAMVLLRKDSHHNLNVKAAYLHLLGDTLSSVAVIVGGILIYFFNIFWIDPLVTVVIGVYILKETFQILKETIDILMQSTPSELNLQAIKAEIEHVEHVANIHHVHAWKINEKEIHFDAHIDIKEDLPLLKLENLRMDIESILKNSFNVAHVTIQFEYGCCDDKNLIANG
jgi:cobalt-zinc-cadmium efflux system protein